MNNRSKTKYKIYCSGCKRIMKDGTWWRCKCENNTQVIYQQISKKVQLPIKKKVEKDKAVGDTPLVYLRSLSSMFGCQIYAKCENQNPTGSFKDRGSVIEVSKAIELGKKGIVCASTGNMAVSLSAFAAKSGLKCIDVIPKNTSNIKLELMRRCGGETIQVDGSYDDCVGIAEKISRDNDYFLCGDYTLRREGQKTIGWEIYKTKIVFDAFIVPIGNGNLGTAIYQGWNEAETGLKQNKKLPQFIGVQPSLCNPLTVAWKNNTSINAQYPKKRTRASAFDVGNPLDGRGILSLISLTKGILTDATDEEMEKGQKLLSMKEGILSELAVGSSIAIINEKKSELKNKTVLIIISGTGLSRN